MLNNQTPVRVLHIASSDFFSTYGGGQVYVKNIVNEMISKKIELGILSAIPNQQYIEKKTYKNIPIYEVPPYSTEDILISAIKDFNPTIIHTHSWEAEFSVISKKLNIPIVITTHHGGLVCPAGALMYVDNRICNRHISHKNCLRCELDNIKTGRFWHPFMKHMPESAYLRLGAFLSKKKFIPIITPIGSTAASIHHHINNWNNICQNSDIVIAPCKAIAQNMIFNGLDRRKVRIVPHGIPLPSLVPEFPEIANGKIKFFYVGRISFIKGLHILLEAFHIIEAPQIELHMIGGTGNKEEERYLAKLHDKYKKDNRIIWHGKVNSEEIYNLTKDYHVACSPSICLEVFGLNIAEALAMKKPVLSTLNGGGEDQIEDGVNGWLVPQNDVAAMKTKMEEIIANPERIESISANCYAISIETHVKELLKIYKELV